MVGLLTLLKKEILRFWKVALQTILAPMISALLYLIIFNQALKAHIEALPDVPYAVFLVPGLIMMAVMQNAFANSSSSMIQSKISGNIVFVLLSPLSYQEIFCAYVLAAMLRGLLVGLGVYLIALLFFDLPSLYSLIWVLLFILLGSAILATLGLIAGLWAEKFDQLAAFQNFIILPLTFLSGVFYTIDSLPYIWQKLSHINPFFYLIDGFRHGFFGTSDVSPYVSLIIVIACLAGIAKLAIKLLQTGYKLRH